ncbi:MAG: dephospho-CoA kinase [Chthoniobacterales bacterium]
MPSLALTGNIGSGKTAALDLLVSLIQEAGITALRFSADEENRTLLEKDPEVMDLIRSSLGADCYTSDGLPNRETISLRISSDPQARNTLEGILHPRLERIWKPLAEAHHLTDQSFFVAEIPLLYEKGLSSFFDKVLVVGCSDSIRKERLLKSRSVSAAKADEWLALQQPQNDKISQADHLLWNDGTVDTLSRQIRRFLKTFDKS